MGGLYSKVTRPVKYVTEGVQTDESMFEPNLTSLVCTPRMNVLHDRLLDPRSISLGIDRTPIILPEVLQSTGNETPKLRPYLETDIDDLNVSKPSRPSLRRSLADEDTRRPVTVEDTCKSLTGEDTLPQQVNPDEDYFEKMVMEPEVREEALNEHPKEDTLEDLAENGGKEVSVKTKVLITEVIRTHGSEVVDLRRKLFLTPDFEPASPKHRIKSGRTPLGIVCCNTGGGNSGGNKTWKGLNEERHRLGLENTPPALPPLLDTAQSCPGGKLPRTRSRPHPRWDLDTSLLI